MIPHRILDADEPASFSACTNSGDGRDHGNLGSHAIVAGIGPLCYDCAAPLIYDRAKKEVNMKVDDRHLSLALALALRVTVKVLMEDLDRQRFRMQDQQRSSHLTSRDEGEIAATRMALITLNAALRGATAKDFPESGLLTSSEEGWEEALQDYADRLIREAGA